MKKSLIAVFANSLVFLLFFTSGTEVIGNPIGANGEVNNPSPVTNNDKPVGPIEKEPDPDPNSEGNPGGSNGDV
ncbi:hypothetical protein [Bacillus horti]|uniref:Uncharacterized protein n=1 Tax=Caldalkalibacillus horti TaxID=77523 RepID=A0ABT9VYV6_9BACI|nr:hypothetical protein [Bacillus horti]MDQ0166171.1 hypothetical protein [Bacillus horti]